MQMEGRRGLFSFPVSDWKDWMGRYAGDSLRLTVLAYQSDQWKRYRSFSIYIAPDSIDSYLSYRLVPPGYEGWREWESTSVTFLIMNNVLFWKIV